MKYVLKEGFGSHRENGVTYNAGQTIDTPNPLDKMFPDKFELVGESDPNPRLKTIQAPDLTPAGTPDTVSEQPPEPAATDVQDEFLDVTKDFPSVNGDEQRILSDGKAYRVVDADRPTIVLKEAKNLRELKKFLKG